MKRTRLQKEIHKAKPFQSAAQEAFLNVQRTADVLMNELAQGLKPAGLSPTQYNVLRILRGVGKAGLACGEISERMISRDPDMTRLLDRLNVRGFISRSRDGKDRRVICVRVTAQALKLLKELDQVVLETHERQLGHLGKQRLETLVELLEAAREREM